jgi:molybdenum cofactor synthesis domain-containing protein
MRAKVLTVSDGVIAGTRQDKSGAALAERLRAAGWEVTDRWAVADGDGPVAEALKELAWGWSGVIVTTGGTGFAPRDRTPEATRAVLDREAPGLAEAMRAESARHTPLGILTRGIAGIAESTLIINFPGSPKAIEQLFPVVAPVLRHAVQTLRGDSSHGARHGG